MRAVVSRVAWARVVADGELTGEIGPGLLVLVGVTHADGEADTRWLAAKVAGLRVFDDGQGRMNRSLAAVLLYTSPSPRDGLLSRMPSSA
jgi:D-tyrosyl-tRNA(Tyr) deacylase